MTKARMLTLLVVSAHWVVAVLHLFLAAKVLPAPNNNVSWLAITLNNARAFWRIYCRLEAER